MRRVLAALVLAVAVATISGCASDVSPAEGTVVVPEVVGLDEAAAAAALLQANLTWRWVPAEVSDSEAGSPEWLVTAQEPAAGAMVEEFSTVLLTAQRAEAPEPSPEPTITATIQPGVD